MSEGSFSDSIQTIHFSNKQLCECFLFRYSFWNISKIDMLPGKSKKEWKEKRERERQNFIDYPWSDIVDA